MGALGAQLIGLGHQARAQGVEVGGRIVGHAASVAPPEQAADGIDGARAFVSLLAATAWPQAFEDALDRVLGVAGVGQLLGDHGREVGFVGEVRPRPLDDDGHGNAGDVARAALALGGGGNPWAGGFPMKKWLKRIRGRRRHRIPGHVVQEAVKRGSEESAAGTTAIMLSAICPRAE